MVGLERDHERKKKNASFNMIFLYLKALFSCIFILSRVPQMMMPAQGKPNLCPQENGYLWKICVEHVFVVSLF